jgi:hypothetical protein
MCAFRDRRLSLWFTRILPSSGALRSEGWLSTDISGLRICPILKGQAVQEGSIRSPETSMLNQSTPRNVSEDGIIKDFFTLFTFFFLFLLELIYIPKQMISACILFAT